ncbi:hypothetical protein JKP88DRAFT_255308 [Tribonema minus]|uniref:LysM domain-containing protein n=1 Tax=Tribonema minus TaxID=303371 RepID=A0A835Z1M2_9STRA|nr:hypothetical protein JKP88DRAFT_255308 [Tribonema minus]
MADPYPTARDRICLLRLGSLVTDVPDEVWRDCRAGARLAIDTVTCPSSGFPCVIIEALERAVALTDIMASLAVDALLQGSLHRCRRLAVLAATLDVISSLGAARLRAILAPADTGSSSMKQKAVSKAFLAHLDLCGGAHVRNALRMNVTNLCTCLDPAPSGADLAEDVLGPGSRFVWLKEAAALSFSEGSLDTAMNTYCLALKVMLVTPAGRAGDLLREQSHARVLEIGKVRANMSLVELRRGNAMAALQRAADAAATAPFWFKAHARRGVAYAALRHHAAASAAYAIAADLAPTPRDAAEFPTPGGSAAAAGARYGGTAGDWLASIGLLLRALEEAMHDAAVTLAAYISPSDLARLERTCQFFGARPLHSRVRIRRAVRCQPARNLCRSAAASALPAAAATAPAAAAEAAAGAEVAVRKYCDAAADEDSCAARQALAAALAVLTRSHVAPAAAGAMARALQSVACADAPTAERCVFWRACAGEAALQELLLSVGEVCAAKFLLRETTAALEVRTRCMRALQRNVAEAQAAFEDACEAGMVTGTHVAAAPRWVRDARLTVDRQEAAIAAAAVSDVTNAALEMLGALLDLYKQRLKQRDQGVDIARYLVSFNPLFGGLPQRLPAARELSALSAQHYADVAAQLPPHALPGAVRAHFAYAADAAEVRAALEADPRMLRVWRVALRPMGFWLARNRWGYLTALAMLAMLRKHKSESDGVAANVLTFALYVLLRGEGWGSGALAQAAFDRVVASVDALAEFFADFYAMVRSYSFVLPLLFGELQCLQQLHSEVGRHCLCAYIAAQVGQTPSSIISLNQLANGGNLIYPGQILLIPPCVLTTPISGRRRQLDTRACAEYVAGIALAGASFLEGLFTANILEAASAGLTFDQQFQNNQCSPQGVTDATMAPINADDVLSLIDKEALGQITAAAEDAVTQIMPGGGYHRWKTNQVKIGMSVMNDGRAMYMNMLLDMETSLRQKLNAWFDTRPAYPYHSSTYDLELAMYPSAYRPAVKALYFALAQLLAIQAELLSITNCGSVRESLELLDLIFVMADACCFSVYNYIKMPVVPSRCVLLNNHINRCYTPVACLWHCALWSDNDCTPVTSLPYYAEAQCCNFKLIEYDPVGNHSQDLVLWHEREK